MKDVATDKTSKEKKWIERSAMLRAEQESRGDIVRARRKAEIDLIITAAEDIVEEAQYLESKGDLKSAIREVKRLFSDEFCRLQSRLNKLPFYDAAMKILMRPEVERQEQRKRDEVERQKRCKMDEECFLMNLEDKWSHCKILEYLQLEYSSIGILLEFKAGTHGTASRELLRHRICALPLLHRSGCFQSIFPKRCPGCVGLNLVCAAELLNDSQLIFEVIKTLLAGWARLYSIDKIRSFQTLSKKYYQRRSSDRYPYMGNCLDFGLANSSSSSQGNKDFLRDMNTLGKLLCEGEGMGQNSSKS